MEIEILLLDGPDAALDDSVACGFRRRTTARSASRATLPLGELTLAWELGGADGVDGFTSKRQRDGFVSISHTSPIDHAPSGSGPYTKRCSISISSVTTRASEGTRRVRSSRWGQLKTFAIPWSKSWISDSGTPGG